MRDKTARAGVEIKWVEKFWKKWVSKRPLRPESAELWVNSLCSLEVICRETSPRGSSRRHWEALHLPGYARQPVSTVMTRPLLQPQTCEVGKWKAVCSPFSLSLWTKRNHQNFVKASDRQWTKPRSGKHTTHAQMSSHSAHLTRAWGHRSRRPLRLEHLSSFGGFHFCSYPRTIQIQTNCCHLLVNSILIMNLQKWGHLLSTHKWQWGVPPEYQAFYKHHLLSLWSTMCIRLDLFCTVEGTESQRVKATFLKGHPA